MIPDKDDVIWRDLVTGNVEIKPNFLGLKLLLLRSNMAIARAKLSNDDKLDETVTSLAADVHDFFQANEKYLGHEITTLFG